MNSKCLLIAMFFVAANSCGDFYWRDYDGKIPSDAIPAGENSKGLSYIGQAYIHNYGLLLGTIIPGKMEISVPCYGVKKIDVIIKVLCAEEDAKYYWLPTTTTTYQKDIADKCPVLGGYDQKVKDITNLPLGTLHVGRTRSQGDVIIGNIAAYDKSHTWFYYPLNDTEVRAAEYEVLIYGDHVPSKLNYREYNFVLEYSRTSANASEHTRISTNIQEHLPPDSDKKTIV